MRMEETIYYHLFCILSPVWQPPAGCMDAFPPLDLYHEQCPNSIVLANKGAPFPTLAQLEGHLVLGLCDDPCWKGLKYQK